MKTVKAAGRLQQENERLRARVQDWESAHQAQKERADYLQHEVETQRTLLRELAEALVTALTRLDAYEEKKHNADLYAALARAEEVLK